MKINHDLIRDILLKVEASDSVKMTCSDFVTGEYDECAISHHVKLLKDAGYIEAMFANFLNSPYAQFKINRITFQGYEYLELTRDNTAWGKIKKELKNLSSIPLEIAKIKILQFLGF